MGSLTPGKREVEVSQSSGGGQMLLGQSAFLLVPVNLPGTLGAKASQSPIFPRTPETAGPDRGLLHSFTRLFHSACTNGPAKRALLPLQMSKEKTGGSE